MILDLTIDELLSTTRCVRRRLDLARPVEREVLEECLLLAQQAPTASYREDWHFVVLRDAEPRGALGAVCGQGGRRRTAIVAVACRTGTDFKPAGRKPLDTMVHWDRW